MENRTVYKNAISYKLHNRRVTVVKLDNEYGFVFQVLDGYTEDRAMNLKGRNGVCETRIKLSQEITMAMMQAVYDLMNKEK